jgi:hypothetical protein
VLPVSPLLFAEGSFIFGHGVDGFLTEMEFRINFPATVPALIHEDNLAL